MKTLTKDNILSFEIEDFARIIHNKDFTKSDLELKVKEMKLSANILEAVLNKISLANKKIKVSISARDKVLALFFPFGLIINLLPNYNYFDQINKDLNSGFGRKASQRFKFSVFGAVLYIIIVLVIVLK